MDTALGLHLLTSAEHFSDTSTQISQALAWDRGAAALLKVTLLSTKSFGFYSEVLLQVMHRMMVQFTSGNTNLEQHNSLPDKETKVQSTVSHRANVNECSLRARHCAN